MAKPERDTERGVTRTCVAEERGESKGKTKKKREERRKRQSTTHAKTNETEKPDCCIEQLAERANTGITTPQQRSTEPQPTRTVRKTRTSTYTATDIRRKTKRRERGRKNKKGRKITGRRITQHRRDQATPRRSALAACVRAMTRASARARGWRNLRQQKVPPCRKTPRPNPPTKHLEDRAPPAGKPKTRSQVLDVKRPTAEKKGR